MADRVLFTTMQPGAATPISDANPMPVAILSGGGGGAVTIADGGNTTQGSLADPKATDSTSAWSVIALLKGLYALLSGTLTAAISGTVSVTGTFWQATQPVSLAALPALAAGE